MEPGLSPKEAEHERFARQLTQELLARLDQDAYGQLVLVANPDFLGMLRARKVPCAVARSFNEAIDILEKWGAL